MSATIHMDQLLAIAAMDEALIPTAARRMAMVSLFDWMVVARAGSEQPSSRIIRRFVLEEGGQPVASVIGSPVRIPARAAALANGTISHALDYDDTHFAHVAHPSVAILPAALAAGEARDQRASSVVAAFLLGAEASCRIGMVLGRDHYDRGFHQTATAGAVGATVAAGRIYGLSTDQMRNALSLVTTRASGLKSQFGTMGKAFNAGIAAANGVEAASLAELGFISSEDGFGGVQGFIETHSLAPIEVEPWRDPPPKRFVFQDIKYKLHACCHGTHAMIEALREIKNRHDIKPELVKGLVLRTNPRWLKVCDVKVPRTGLEAKFSYAMLAGMTLQGIDTASDAAYRDELCADAALVDVARRVEVAADETIAEMAADVTLTMADGTTHRASHDLAVPMAADALERGLREKAGSLLGESAAGRLWDAVSNIENRSARQIGGLLTC